MLFNRGLDVINVELRRRRCVHDLLPLDLLLHSPGSKLHD